MVQFWSLERCFCPRKDPFKKAKETMLRMAIVKETETLTHAGMGNSGWMRGVFFVFGRFLIHGSGCLLLSESDNNNAIRVMNSG
jgi:hypothetical protein